jgi:hypothetical protein
LEVLGTHRPAAELDDLYRTLREDDNLRRADIQPRLRPPGDGALGPVLDAVLVTLGGGGAGVALVRTVGAWLATRHDSIRVRITSGSRTYEIDMPRSRDPRTVVELVRFLEEPGGE